MNKGALIGAYNCFENKKTVFIYKCNTQVKGFMIRKHIWRDLVKEIPELGNILRENVQIKYMRHIYLKVMHEKKQFLKKM